MPGLGSWTWIVAGCFAVLLYASVLVHELGHAMAARAYGLPVHRITLQMLGGVTETSRKDVDPGAPVRHRRGRAAPLAASSASLGIALAQVLSAGTVLHLLAVQLGAANLLVGVFNLLPGLPLDGGQLVRAVVWKATGNPGDGHRRRRVDRAGAGRRPRRRACGHLAGPRARTGPGLHRVDGADRRLRVERSRAVAAGRARADQAAPAVGAGTRPAGRSRSSPTPRSPRRCASSPRAGRRRSSSWTARTSRSPWSARRR